MNPDDALLVRTLLRILNREVGTILCSWKDLEEGEMSEGGLLLISDTELKLNAEEFAAVKRARLPRDPR